MTFEAESGGSGRRTAAAGESGASGGSAIELGVPAGTVTCTGSRPAAFAFDRTDGRAWPTVYGQALVTTWRDDKLAAATLTIDDNLAFEHDFWIAKGNETGFKFTWFVITGNEPGQQELPVNSTWDDFRRLHRLGHSIQSHYTGVTIPADRTDFQLSQQLVTQEIGERPLTNSYPNGEADNKADAADFYIASRGTEGRLNPLTPRDFQEISTVSGNVNLGNPNNYNYLPALLDQSFTDDSVDYYGGWVSVLYHKVVYGAGHPDDLTAKVDQLLRWLKNNESDIWVSTFDRVAQYARERNAASLSVTGLGQTCVEFDLTDNLDDADYFGPLTVKIRLEGGNWSSIEALQNGQPVTAKLVIHEGNNYVLVEAVPGAGPVVVYKPAD